MAALSPGPDGRRPISSLPETSEWSRPTPTKAPGARPECCPERPARSASPGPPGTSKGRRHSKGVVSGNPLGLEVAQPQGPLQHKIQPFVHQCPPQRADVGQEHTLPSLPQYCRATPTDFFPCLGISRGRCQNGGWCWGLCGGSPCGCPVSFARQPKSGRCQNGGWCCQLGGPPTRRSCEGKNPTPFVPPSPKTKPLTPTPRQDA